MLRIHVSHLATKRLSLILFLKTYIHELNTQVKILLFDKTYDSHMSKASAGSIRRRITYYMLYYRSCTLWGRYSTLGLGTASLMSVLLSFSGRFSGGGLCVLPSKNGHGSDE
ncbi:hypothetical protein NC652_018878 [Populus alba x Populus x berolinensis]|uniref:Uncharacterized protein n=1 Tax=Populus alba x Populus x berolinensis TaxID=444605 RepID=A0AAD6QH33_9ROSI|nr:hypothetical protein NC652_018878 [Populus alba x Populus x berolinensis]KAJ6990267.1 hypothetical protein NC653_018728 [Populus alba x Populus x berolinensis]